MEDFKQILKRVNFDGMISYLMYGVSSKEKQEGTYEERVQDAYDRILTIWKESFLQRIGKMMHCMTLYSNSPWLSVKCIWRWE